MWCSVYLLTLLLLAAGCHGQLPEDDFRVVNRQDLLASDSDLFEDNSTKSFSQLLFDVARDQVIVGARDTLYRLSLRGLRQLERAEWPAPADLAKTCQDKGQSEDDCHNYVKVLLAFGHKLFVCGTNAFSPLCSWREIESVSTVSEWVTGVANCPCSPHSNVTSILASSGEYYAGTPTDFASSDTAICRSRGAALRDVPTLRTTQYDLNWLNEPHFAGSFEDDQFVYFVFREVAVEFMNCGKTMYSRIARVCKNDSGGQHSMSDVGTWSTFLKARLTCPVPGDVPFYYDEVQSIEYLPQEKILVATFTTNSNSIAGSALCVYNMSDISAAFDGPYRAQERPSATWEQRAPSPRARDHFQCRSDQRPNLAMEYHRYHFMYDSVQPIYGEPVYKVTLQRFTYVTVDVAATKSGSQLVAYVATGDSDILKLAVWPRYDGACLVEVLKLKDSKTDFVMRNMQFVKDTMSLYIGSETAVLRVSGEHCARYRSRSSCATAADPHCGWDDASDACVHSHDPNFTQATVACASDDTPVDGGWSAWGEWAPCMQHGTASTPYGDGPDACRCRARRCDDPRPARGGLDCQGASIAVTNCTVHGGWSSWSCWSACSATCGIAVKSRRRACAAPEPRHGGRVCVGLDAQDVFCTNLPPCPDPALAPVDGGWSAWGPWSPCAGAGGPGCGRAGGWRERRRACDRPAPAHRGAPCEGPRSERQQCDMRPCEQRKATAWTPWVQALDGSCNTTDGSYTEKRFKFQCRAPSPEQIKLTIAREEERFCTSLGACSSTPPGATGAADAAAGWEAWEEWGACSAACGGGQQARSRRCRRARCVGAPDVLRACNTHACDGEWSCWTDWSECSATCEGGGAGQRTRTRSCLSPAGCAGAALEHRACAVLCPESEVGWGAWAEWTSCAGGERLRLRTCAARPCDAAQLQLARDSAAPQLFVMPAFSLSVEMASFVTLDNGQNLSVGGIVGCVVAAFVMGCLLSLAGAQCWRRRALPWRRGARVPSSPHYITAKQNSYVTVPLKELPRKAKRHPSFTCISGSSGIVVRNNLSAPNNQRDCAATPKLYPKAIASEYDSAGTLRRHSAQPNNKANVDVEEDKFY